MATTAAQDEFNDLIANCSAENSHPQDRRSTSRDGDGNGKGNGDEYDDQLDEETQYQNARIEAAMRSPTIAPELQLPPASFDRGRSTGVKGVIADARSFQTARKSKWSDKVRSARRSIMGTPPANQDSRAKSKSESETDSDTYNGNTSDDETFLVKWRETRRRELEAEANRAVRTRRTSPSVRVYGRLDKVDAMGYLDAIEKVGRDTKVVVFVNDDESDVSATIESALLPLVEANSTIHFVKVHYEDIEFDNAAVPALLAYRSQGDLFANLTGLLDLMPEEDSLGTTNDLKRLLQQHQVL